MPYIGFPDYEAKLDAVRRQSFAGFELQRVSARQP
jgi:hypothetical protein